jgi:hypothetical protein
LLHAWGGIALIVIAVFAVRAMPEPWRGIVDCGVCAALAWGFGAILVVSVRGAASPSASVAGAPHPDGTAPTTTT